LVDGEVSGGYKRSTASGEAQTETTIKLGCRDVRHTDTELVKRMTSYFESLTRLNCFNNGRVESLPPIIKK